MASKTRKKIKEDAVVSDEQVTASIADTKSENTPQLTLADIKNAVNVIDYAAGQGALKGWEIIGQVMQVRQRLAAFVEFSTPKTEGEQAVEPDNNEVDFSA